jgi:hypothetical protein
MEAFIVVQPRKKKIVTVSDTTIVLNNENTFSEAFNGDDKAIKRTKTETKTLKKKKKKLSEDNTKSKTKKRITPSWELLLECAIRAEQIGNIGVEVYGRFYSASEIEDRCRFMTPMPPFKTIKSAYEIRTEG